MAWCLAQPCLRLSPNPLHVVMEVWFDPLFTLLFSILSLHVLFCFPYLLEFHLEKFCLSDSQHSFHTKYPLSESKAHLHATTHHPLVKPLAWWVICSIFYWEGWGKLGLLKGHQEVERELVELRGHVKQLEDKLHKEGNWRIAKVKQVTQRREDNNVDKQGVDTRSIQNITPGVCRVVNSPAPAPIPPPIHSMNTWEVNWDTNNSCYCHFNPWGSISQWWGHHLQSHIYASQSNFWSPNMGYIQYIIPLLCPTLVTDIMSSSLLLPACLFSCIWDCDKSVAMREGLWSWFHLASGSALSVVRWMPCHGLPSCLTSPETVSKPAPPWVL